MKIAVYCSAKDAIPEEYLALGDAVGAWIGAHGHTLIYGGATGGLMSRTSDAAKAAGATVIGARNFLIAFNISLNTQDVTPAKAIAAVLREKNGGLKSVKAIGWNSCPNPLIFLRETRHKPLCGTHFYNCRKVSG